MNYTPNGEAYYNPAYYDAAYYGGGGRGGFTSYKYGSKEQDEQLRLKMHFCDHVPHQSALFVGCALGFEVAWWIRHGLRARGLDVSKYAIENQIPFAGGNCELFDGRNIPCIGMFDLVASFDVLHHLPDEYLLPLVRDMIKVARKGIVFRVVVKNWRNVGTPLDGQDGAWLKYRPLEEWDRLFSESGEFKLDWLKMHHQYEVTAIYKRV